MRDPEGDGGVRALGYALCATLAFGVLWAVTASAKGPLEGGGKSNPTLLGLAGVACLAASVFWGITDLLVGFRTWRSVSGLIVSAFWVIVIAVAFARA